MREIKFRGLMEYGGWVYGTPVFYKSGEVCIFGLFPYYGCEATNIQIRNKILPETLSQFTGLKDKNGKKVYEGDICKFNKEPEEMCFFHGLAYIDNKEVGGSWEIIRCDNVHPEIPELKGEDCLDSSAFWNDDFEIIGNVVKNPELLNQ